MAFFLLNLFYFCTRQTMFVAVLAVLMLLVSINTAIANTSWQWSHAQDKERIVINLDDNSEALSLERITKQQLALSLSQTPRQFIGDNNAIRQSKMLSQISLHGNIIGLNFKSPDFGYMVTYPSPKQVVIDLFYDPLGARWAAKGKLLPRNSTIDASKNSDKNDLSAILDEQYNILKAKDYLGVSVNSALENAENAENNVLENAENSVLENAENNVYGSVPTELDATELKDEEASYWSRFKTMLSSKAYAAQEILSDIVKDKPVIISPQNIRSPINRQGPESLDSQESLSTSLEQIPEPKENIQDFTENEGFSFNSILNSIKKAVSSAVGFGDEQEDQADTVVPANDKPIEAVENIQKEQVAPKDVPAKNAGIKFQVSPPAASEQRAAVNPPVASEQKVATPPADSEQELKSALAKQEPAVSVARQKVEPPKPVESDVPVVEVPVIYQNEQGEVIPKPLEPEEVMANATTLIEEGAIAESLAMLNELKKMPMSRALLEKVLYMISDTTAALYVGKALEGYDPIVSTTSEAMNANLQSSRVPDMLFRLGLVNLNVGNIKEAEGYFKYLKNRFPYDLNVPISFVALGQDQLKLGKYDDAIASFKVLLDEYIESSSLKLAVIGLANALYAKGDIEELDIITDFIGKRWPRLYIDDQKYLLMLAESFVNRNKLKEALETYWHYYNLVPDNPENHILLARIGDLYLRTNQTDLAYEVFDSVINRFPGTEGAAYATLRKAELGIHDSPITLAEMFDTFSKIEDKAEPNKSYNKIMDTYGNKPIAVLAHLKMAMLKLWDKQYVDAIATAADFIDKHPDHKDVNEARDIVYKSFQEEYKRALAEQNYGRILSLWNGFPLIRQRYGKIDSDMRHALARGHLEKGEDSKTLEYLSEFLKTPKDPKYSDYAFTLFFNKYLQSGDWNAILDLADLVADWEMDPKVKGQLDYAQALAAENLGLTAKALPLWRNLANKKANVELYEKAYATYFLAKDAERRKHIEDSYKYNMDTLSLFRQLEQDRSDKADPERIKEAVGSLMDITEVANRIPESLKWVQEYKDHIPKDSPDLTGLRFREARLHRKLGDLDKSKSILEQIVESAPESPFGMAAALELRTFEVSRNLRNFLPEDAQ